MRLLKLALPAVVAATALAGCGGTTSADSGDSGGGEGKAPGVSKTEIKFGMVGPLTGPVSALGLDSRAAVEAMMAKVNDEGGINGRKLTLSVQDDKYDPKQSVAGAKYFSGQEEVFGIWGNVGTATLLSALPTYEAAGLPLLFPESFSDKLQEYDKAYTVSKSFDRVYNTLSDYMATAEQFKGKKIGFFYQNDGTSIESVDGFKKGASKISSSVTFERTANSYAPQVARLKAEGAEVILYVGNPSQLAVALKQADAISYKPQWIGSLGITSPDTSKLAGKLAEGVMTVNPHSSPQSSDPGAVAFRAAMDKYQPKATQSGYALFSWIGGVMVVDALKRAGENPTQESFLKALNETKDLDLGGLVPPVSLTAEDRVANDCILLLTDKSGVFEKDGDFVCPEEA